jgi:dihydroorotate dehydrogenase
VVPIAAFLGIFMVGIRLGADAVMTTSALLRHGVGDVKMLVDGVTQWLDAREVASIDSAGGVDEG